MTTITLNFNPKEDYIIEDLKEIAGKEPLSKFTKNILFEHVKKYNTNPILAERNSESEKIEGLIQILNDMPFMNRAIQNMNPETTRIFENTIFALQTKVSKKLRYGTVNVS